MAEKQKKEKVAKPKTPCIACQALGIQRNAMTRGLCSGHATQAREVIAAGKTTWDKLVNAGRALKISRSPNMTDWFLKGEVPKV